MALNLTLLRSFWMVAKAGSVSGAARAGHTSQPALSKAVKELERQVGVPLLERGARGVRLTEAGRDLMEHASAVFAIERAAEETMRAHQKLEAVTLRVGASTTIATYALPPLLARFEAQHPGVEIRLSSDNTRHIAERLLTYDLDVALVEGPPHDERLETVAWREDYLIGVCAPDHPLAKRKQVWLRDLKEFRWVVREEGSGTREVIENVLRDYGLPPEGALEIDGAEAVKQAIAAGLGIGIVSRVAAADQIALGKLRVLPLAEIELRRPFYLLRFKGRVASLAARAFEASLQTRSEIKTSTRRRKNSAQKNLAS
jgi:DNA-binding transcriptional LysR family regulator